MANRYYKAIITEHDYKWTTYTAWVEASSRNQAIAKASALAGQEKTRREFKRMGRESGLFPSGLLSPDVQLEIVDLDAYWDNRDTVEVSE